MRTAISARRRTAGFTLVELVLAFGIMAVVMTLLIFQRLDAMASVTKTSRERELRRIAQELLDENLALSMSNELQSLTGRVLDPNSRKGGVRGDEFKEGWTWEWREEVNQEGDEFIRAYTIIITYPDPDAPKEDPRDKQYELTQWVIPTDEQRELIAEEQQLRLEEGGMGIDGYGDL